MALLVWPEIPKFARRRHQAQANFGIATLAAAALVLTSANGALCAPHSGGAPRVVSLDQCADQYVLALSPHAAIAGLSYRAEAGDSYLADAAKGLPKRRTTLESLLATQPQVVVRSWGGDAQLVRRLEDRGVRVTTLKDATDFDGVRANLREAAVALGEQAKGEALIQAMDRDLAVAGRRPSGKTVAYLTPGGATAGPRTLVDAMLRAAGLRNAEQGPGYRTLSLERMALQPPEALVLGFFDAFSLDHAWWSPARTGPMQAARGRAIAKLPGAVLSCPAWFAAAGVLTLAKAARP
jgi:iron complex transport system substrate-binding protein